ncbi:MAG: dCTP deaminase [Acetobacteraceae bacterium]
MILTDREIKIALERGSLVIDPRPDERAFASTSIDLTLDQTFSVFRQSQAGVDVSIDPALDGFDHDAAMEQITQRQTIDPIDGYLLPPRKLVLAWSAEYLDLRRDPRLAARVEGKSSLGRLGLGVHVTAPTIHAGFDGRIRLEIINHGLIPVKLRAGMRICQLIFEVTLGTPDKGYRGRFAGQNVTRKG